MALHNPLSTLPARVLLDANVLLDATFVAGLARRAVLLLRKLSFSPSVDHRSWSEAEARLDSLKRRLSLPFEPTDFVKALAAQVGIIVLPPAPAVCTSAVNRADRHIVDAALEYRAWLLTSDSPLAVECRSVGIAARLPWDVIMEDAKEQPLAMDQIIRAAPLSVNTGTIFARVMPGSWAGSKSVGQFTICDVQDVGRVYYDSDDFSWAFTLHGGAEVRLPCKIKSGEPWAVCATYSLPGLGKRGRLTLRIGQHPSTSSSRSVQTLKILKQGIGQKISVGSSLKGNHYWNGHVRAVVTGSQTVNADTWKAIISIPEGAPNPYDANALEGALRAVMELGQSSRIGVLERPTEEDLRRCGHRNQ